MQNEEVIHQIELSRLTMLANCGFGVVLDKGLAEVSFGHAFGGCGSVGLVGDIHLKSSLIYESK